jgi:hypothetical protein
MPQDAKEVRFTYSPEEVETLVKLDEDYKHLEHVWTHNGWDTNQKKQLTLNETMTTPNFHIFLPKIMQKIVLDAQEPILIGAKLLRRINNTAGVQIMEFPSVGATGQADVVSELGEYKSIYPSISGAMVQAKIGKYGVRCDFSEEMLKYSTYDVYNMMLELAGRDMARLKEKIIFTFIMEFGTTIFDNVNFNDITASVNGPTTGRDRKGHGNGSITLDDIFDMFAHIINQGWTPDAMLIHPMTWLMWVKDPIMRMFALNSGGGTWFAGWNGNPVSRDPWNVAGGQIISSGRNVGKTTDIGTPLDFNWEAQNSSMRIPSMLPIPLKLIVSPLVPYSWEDQLTNIMMFDSRNLGVLVVDEDPNTQKWDDPSVDLHSVKIRERYGVAILNEGQGIAVAKGVKVNAYNEFILPAQVMADVDSAEDIDFGTNVLD